jgi:hypothetical protein
MSYTYLSSTPYSSEPVIIMTSPPSSRKSTFLEANPKVSLLVHDWVSHRPPTLEAQLSTSPDGGPGRTSGLASLLAGINSAALSRISVSINGTAKILDQESEEATWFKARHKESNTFGDTIDDTDAGCYIESQEVLVVVVTIKDGRISDWKGTTKDFNLSNPGINGI